MAGILDAGGLYAQADRADPKHAGVVEILIAEKGSLVTSEVAVAEADYLILTRLGIEVELAFLDDLAEGTFLVECLTREELGVARDLACRHRDLELGLADVSLMVLAGRYHTRRIVTFDERAFRTVTPLQGRSFTVLPADTG
ncbi:MAG TPA: PIN domain-containing protein [Rubrobacteraceae bacterium]|nr:PIN domain-containing protein [Rubrobacteraceae bacterium]